MLVAPRQDTTAHYAAQATSHTEKRKKKRKNAKGTAIVEKGKWSTQNKIGEKKILPEGVEIFLSATL